jgi:hypothetical protein
MSASDPRPQTGVATRLLAGVTVPDTPTIARAIGFARAGFQRKENINE